MINAYSGLGDYAFLSYSHKDIDFVNGLLETLTNVGCRVWYNEGILPSEEWIDKIAVKIALSKFFIVVISKNSIESEYVKKEIFYASLMKIPFLIIYKEHVELPHGLKFQLNSIQAVTNLKKFKNELDDKKEDIFPKSILGECGKIIYQYSKYEYRFFPNKNTFTIIKINKDTNERVNLYLKVFSDEYDAAFGIHSINSAIPFEFHNYEKNTLFFEVFCDLFHLTDAPNSDLFANYRFAIVNPNKDDSKLILEKCLVKKQNGKYNNGCENVNEYFIKNNLIE